MSYTATEGGTVSAASNVDQKLSTAKVTGATATVKPGYEFAGWYLRTYGEPESEGGEPTYTDAKVTEDLTLTAADAKARLAKDKDGLYADTAFVAKFQAEGDRTYTVTYEADPYVKEQDDGTEVSVSAGEVETKTNADIQVLSTEGVTGSVALPANGYKFAGWYVRTYVDEQRQVMVPKLEEKWEKVKVPVLDEDGHQKYDDYGEPMYIEENRLVVDEDGNPILQPVLDKDGNPVMEPKKDENGNLVYETVSVAKDELVAGARASLTKDQVVAELEKRKDADGLYADLLLVCKFAEKSGNEPDEDFDPYTVTYKVVDGTLDVTSNPNLDATSTDGVTGATAKANAGFEFVGWFVETIEYVPDASGAIQEQKVEQKIDGAGLTLSAWEAQAFLQKDDTGLYIDTTFIARFQKAAVKEDLSKESVNEPETLGDRDPILIEYWDTRAIKNADGTYEGAWITIDELDRLNAQPDREPTVAVEGYYKNSNKFRYVTQVRWTYYDLPATMSDDGTTAYKLDDVALVGVARYQDNRDSTGELYEYWTADRVPVDFGYTHRHAETTQLDFYQEGADGEKGGPILTPAVKHFEKTVEGQTKSVLQTKQDSGKNVNFTVYRRTPVIRFQNQVFQTEAQAKGTGAKSWNASQKTGYIPGEKFWYKDTLWNVPRGTNSYMDVEGELYHHDGVQSRLLRAHSA